MSEVKLDANGLVTPSISLGGNTLSSDGDKLLWNGEEFASSSGEHNIGGHSVGEQWISMDGTIPLGGIPFNGQILNTADYQALYNWAKDNNLFKTESEWQTLKTNNNNNVPFYSKEADTPGQKAKSDFIEIEYGDRTTTPTHIIFNGKSYDFNDVVYENINSLDELPFTVNATFSDFSDPGMASYSWFIEFEAKHEGVAGNNIVIEFQGSNSPINNIVVQLKGGVDSSEPSTFRVPLFRGYLKADSGSGYIKQGLPNITGTINEAYGGYGVWGGSGAFSIVNGSNVSTRGGGGGNVNDKDVTFNASRSNAIYGRSSNVTPETSKILVGVYAFNTVVNAAVLDATNEITSNINLSIAKQFFDIGYPYADSSGALLALRSVNYTNNPGGFELFAKDATKQMVLGGRTDGTLTWDGKPIIRLVASWRSGTSWYRKYSDGFIEQGGRFTYSQTNGGHAKLNFHTSFSNTNYQIVGSGYRTDSSPNQGFATFRDFNTSYCNTAFWDDNTSNPGIINWYACGY